jgi:hypothetical protein
MKRVLALQIVYQQYWSINIQRQTPAPRRPVALRWSGIQEKAPCHLGLPISLIYLLDG